MSAVCGTVFDIQGYSIHDGPGIRTTVFLSGCPLRCQWCQNPESNTAQQKLLFIRERCKACQRCSAVCSTGAITFNDGRLINDRSKCAACGSCVNVCPAQAREISGKVMTAREVFERVEKERVFFEASGGGVTLSGGEVLNQPAFASEVLWLCKEAGLHTAIETCGFGAWDAFLPILKNTDLVLFDIKHMNPAKHRQGTGVDNELILENAVRIRKELGKEMTVRVPIIPDYNDDKINLKDTALFVAERLGKDVKIHLLPYHRLGESKHERLEDNFKTLGLSPPADEKMTALRDYISRFGIDTKIGG